MKCPWCSRSIGWPSINRSSAQCPYCSGQYTYAFRGRTLWKYLLPASLAGWLLLPYLGALVLVLIFGLLLVSSVYLEKWF